LDISGKDKVTTPLGNGELFNYGLVFGLGTDLDFLVKNFFLDFRLNLGLANILSRPEEYSQLKSYHDEGMEMDLSLILSLGYKF